MFSSDIFYIIALSFEVSACEKSENSILDEFDLSSYVDLE